MTKRLVSISVLACFGMLTAAAGGQSGGTVTIAATVVNKMAVLVSDLTQSDFQVFDNGKRQTITTFENAVKPVTMVFLVDRSGNLVWDPNVVWHAAEEFVRACVKPGDKAKVGTFSSKVLIAPAEFTGDRDALLEALHASAQSAGWTPLWTAASAALDALAAQSGRRVLFVISDNSDAPDTTQANATLADVRAKAAASGVIVYAIGLTGTISHGAGQMMTQGRGGRGGSVSRGGATTATPELNVTAVPDPGLKLLSSDTGGDYFEFQPGSNVPDAFAYIGDEIHHQYLIGFLPTVRDGKPHVIDVRVTKPGLIVKATKTYAATR